MHSFRYKFAQSLSGIAKTPFPTRAKTGRHPPRGGGWEISPNASRVLRASGPGDDCLKQLMRTSPVKRSQSDYELSAMSAAVESSKPAAGTELMNESCARAPGRRVNCQLGPGTEWGGKFVCALIYLAVV
ncbi:hypothetical protein BaRGS_00013760 [Batillaria attramentaria]|uniref:Uncharacterized protein n=1 Tax=Batillaria attramentaria TaxID=370345 RepID=A0ABD0L789_9CAEN